MARGARIGIIGCGNISDTYFTLAPLFKGLKIVACADIKAPLAKAQGRAVRGARRSPSTASSRTTRSTPSSTSPSPTPTTTVTHAILSAGKHAYSEKPLALTAADARKLVAEADKRGVKLGGAPDTFLGAGGADRPAAASTRARSARVVARHAPMCMSHGMEHWHPNPGFFFKPGAGPVFDVGPYYITTLVSLLGAVKGVVALAKKGFADTPRHRRRPDEGQEDQGDDADHHQRRPGIRIPARR